MSFCWKKVSPDTKTLYCGCATVYAFVRELCLNCTIYSILKKLFLLRQLSYFEFTFDLHVPENKFVQMLAIDTNFCFVVIKIPSLCEYCHSTNICHQCVPAIYLRQLYICVLIIWPESSMIMM